jgi:hypothetical protein
LDFELLVLLGNASPIDKYRFRVLVISFWISGYWFYLVTPASIDILGYLHNSPCRCAECKWILLITSSHSANRLLLLLFCHITGEHPTALATLGSENRLLRRCFGRVRKQLSRN